MPLDLSTIYLEKPEMDYDSDDEECEEYEGEGAPWIVTAFRSIYARDDTDKPLKIGWISAEVIKRDEIAPKDFHSIVDIPSQEICDFGTSLFDWNGKMRDKWRGPAGKACGTGIWGQDEALGVGSIAYISEIRILPQYRRQGAATRALALFFEDLNDLDLCHSWFDDIQRIFCWPSIMCSAFQVDETLDEVGKDLQEAEEMEKILGLFLKVGFRRVGKSKYLGFHMDPTHPSRTLPADQDTPLPPSEGHPDRNIDYPLHMLLANEPENVSLITIRASPLALVQQVDRNGVTPLNIAVLLSTLSVVRALVARSRAELFKEDYLGNTPLDTLRNERQANLEFLQAFGMADKPPNTATIEERRKKAEIEAFLVAEMGLGA